MKKFMLFFLSMLVVTSGFAEHFVLNNQVEKSTSNQKSRVAIQWASSAKEVDESNNLIRQGLKLNPDSLQVLTQLGKINLDSPKKAEYFRVLVWINGAEHPEFLTKDRERNNFLFLCDY